MADTSTIVLDKACPLTIDDSFKGQWDAVKRRWKGSKSLIYQGVSFWPWFNRLAAHFLQLQHLSYLAYWPKYDLFVVAVAPFNSPKVLADAANGNKNNHQGYLCAVDFKEPERKKRIIQIRHINKDYPLTKGRCFFEPTLKGIYKRSRRYRKRNIARLCWVELFAAPPPPAPKTGDKAS